MSESKQGKIGNIVAMIIVAMISGGIGMSLGFSKAINEMKDKKAEMQAKMGAMMNRKTPVEVEEVSLRALNPATRFIGAVEPVQEVELKAQVAGYIAKVAFEEGSMVKAGDPLFQIDNSTYTALVAQRTAELAKANAEAERACRYDARMQKVDKRSVTQTEIDSAHAGALQAKAMVKQAEANLLAAKIDLERTLIKAPISGRIGSAKAKLGDYVAPSSAALARIIQTDPIRVVFSISDRDYLKGMSGHVKDNMRYRVMLPTGDFYEKLGTLDFVDNEMSESTASLPIRLRFDNPKQKLLSKGYVSVYIDEKAAAKVTTVPQTAILTNAKGSFVYVPTAEGGVTMRPVTLGVVQGMYVQVSGVAAGEKVVTSGVSQINPTSKVEIVSADAAQAVAPKAAK